MQFLVLCVNSIVIKHLQIVGAFLMGKEQDMAKDDYYVVVFKILSYLYAVLKSKEVFTQQKLERPENGVSFNNM